MHPVPSLIRTSVEKMQRDRYHCGGHSHSKNTMPGSTTQLVMTHTERKFRQEEVPRSRANSFARLARATGRQFVGLLQLEVRTRSLMCQAAASEPVCRSSSLGGFDTFRSSVLRRVRPSGTSNPLDSCQYATALVTVLTSHFSCDAISPSNTPSS